MATGTTRFAPARDDDCSIYFLTPPKSERSYSATQLDLLARAMYPTGMVKTEPSAEEIREVMRYLSSKGASKGGKARKEKLSPERRQEIARKAARARWGKRKSD